MRKAFMFFAAAFISLCSSAQVINGDLDGDNDVTVNDAVLLVNDYVTNSRHYINGANMVAIENSRIVGTWWKSQSSKIILNVAGYTDYGAGYTYKYLPALSILVFYNALGTPAATYEVVRLTDTTLELRNIGSTETTVYSSTQPTVKLVTEITLSSTSRSMSVDDVARLTATVTPSDADNKTIVWTSSNEQVASVSSSGIVAAKAQGTATISATAQDGSGVKATCTVYVRSSSGDSSATRPTGSQNGHNWVDLGTGVKWATMNVGATSPEDYGYYFAWGAKSTQSVFVYVNTPYQTQNTTIDTERRFKKYLGSTTSSYKDSSATDADAKKIVLDPEDDAAYVNWGGSWRMPTKEEISKLIKECYWQWVTSYNGKSVNGYIVYKAKADDDKGKRSYNNPSLVGSYSVSDPHIFLPAGGFRHGNGLDSLGSSGGFWSSSLRESEPYLAYALNFYNDGVSYHGNGRQYGNSVRAVCQ